MDIASTLLALTLATGVVLSGARLVAAAHQTHSVASEELRLVQEVWLAIDLLDQLIRQAGQGLPASANPLSVSALSVWGADDATATVDGGAFGLMPGGVHGSDLIALRAIGDSEGDAINCAGFPVSSLAPVGDEGWSILHVTPGPDGGGELRCKYRGQHGWMSQTLISGVETLQLLYGIDTDGDGLPNAFIKASRVDANGSAHWACVVAVRVGLLVRSPVRVSSLRRSDSQPIALFGQRHRVHHAADDHGTLVPSDPDARGRAPIRQHVDLTLFLRQPRTC